MAVDPLNSRAVPSADSGKVAGSQSARRPEQPAEERHGEATHAAGDSVELSATSRALVEHADGAHGVPQGTMSPEPNAGSAPPPDRWATTTARRCVTRLPGGWGTTSAFPDRSELR